MTIRIRSMSTPSSDQQLAGIDMTDITSTRGYVALLLLVSTVIGFQALAIRQDPVEFERPVLSMVTPFVTDTYALYEAPIELAEYDFEPGALSLLPGEEAETDDDLYVSEPSHDNSSNQKYRAEEDTTAADDGVLVGSSQPVRAPERTKPILPQHTRTHVVRPGESLWLIARRYGAKITDIIEWNDLGGSTTIRPNDELIVGRMPRRDTENTTEQHTPQGDSAGSTSLTYVVQPGDNLHHIAQKFRTSVASLLLNNVIPDPERLYPGQELIVTTANRISHVVNKGETLWELSKLYSVPLKDLIEHNNMRYDTIFPGQRLSIPVKDPRALAALFSRQRRQSFARPVQGRVTSPFGWRVHPILNRRLFHTGVDIAAPAGTTISSIAPGTITFAGWLRGYGRVVVVKHSSGLSSRYAHCQDIKVEVGQRVNTGDKLATVGTTGLATGPHVHLEIRRNGRPINPADYVAL